MRTAIGFSFIFITAYALSILYGWVPAALFFVSTSPIVVIWTAYKILKDPYESENTFEDKFYEDYNYRRNTGRSWASDKEVSIEN